MKQQLEAKAPEADGPLDFRSGVLQRTVPLARSSARQPVTLRRKILGWSTVAGIFVAALTCWGALIWAVLALYRNV